MTTIFTSHHQYHPAPLDQPTPQSPPFFMSQVNAVTKPPAMSEKHQPHSMRNLSSPISPSFSTSKQYHNSASAIPTPSSSTAGTVPETTSYGWGEDMMDSAGELGQKNGKRRSSVSAEAQHDIYRNHDGNSGAKRSRSTELMDIEPSPKLPSLKEMLAQVDPHPLHLVCHKMQVDYLHSIDYLAAHRLSSIAASVARSDPVTGAKRKLRKSYKGKILDLPGKNEIPKAKPPGTEDENKNQSLKMLDMLNWPEDEWEAQKVRGKEIKPFKLDALLRACTMAPGPIPGFDPSVLGLEEKKPSLHPPKASQTPSASVTTPYAQAPNVSTPGGNISSASVSPALMKSELPRASRKKRRKYDESAFEGYGEGYDDEDVEDYGEDGKKKRKRKIKSEMGVSTPSVSNHVGNGFFSR